MTPRKQTDAERGFAAAERRLAGAERRFAAAAGIPAAGVAVAEAAAAAKAAASPSSPWPSAAPVSGSGSGSGDAVRVPVGRCLYAVYFGFPTDEMVRASCAPPGPAAENDDGPMWFSDAAGALATAAAVWGGIVACCAARELVLLPFDAGRSAAGAGASSSGGGAGWRRGNPTAMELEFERRCRRRRRRRQRPRRGSAADEGEEEEEECDGLVDVAARCCALRRSSVFAKLALPPRPDPLAWPSWRPAALLQLQPQPLPFAGVMFGDDPCATALPFALHSRQNRAGAGAGPLEPETRNAGFALVRFVAVNRAASAAAAAAGPGGRGGRPVAGRAATIPSIGVAIPSPSPTDVIGVATFNAHGGDAPGLAAWLTAALRAAPRVALLALQEVYASALPALAAALRDGCGFDWTADAANGMRDGRLRLVLAARTALLRPSPSHRDGATVVDTSAAARRLPDVPGLPTSRPPAAPRVQRQQLVAEFEVLPSSSSSSSSAAAAAAAAGRRLLRVAAVHLDVGQRRLRAVTDAATQAAEDANARIAARNSAARTDELRELLPLPLPLPLPSQSLSLSRPSPPDLLLGDFNFEPGSPEDRWLTDARAYARATPDTPHTTPYNRVDHVYVRRGTTAASATAAAAASATAVGPPATVYHDGAVSDHLLVVQWLNVGGGAAAVQGKKIM